jgi:hypothetical protein
MLMNTSFSFNAISPDKGLGAFEPKAKKASKGGGPEEPARTRGAAARVAPGEQYKAADRRKGGALSREANAVMRRPPPAPEGTGPAARLALSARSSDAPHRPSLAFAPCITAGLRRGHVSRAGRLFIWLCQRRGRERPSLLINNFFSFGVAQPSPKALPLPLRNFGEAELLHAAETEAASDEPGDSLLQG